MDGVCGRCDDGDALRESVEPFERGGIDLNCPDGVCRLIFGDAGVVRMDGSTREGSGLDAGATWTNQTMASAAIP